MNQTNNNNMQQQFGMHHYHHHGNTANIHHHHHQSTAGGLLQQQQQSVIPNIPAAVATAGDNNNTPQHQQQQQQQLQQQQQPQQQQPSAERLYEALRTDVPYEDKKELLEALQYVPELVQFETDPVRFFIKDYNDAIAAAKRLALYWKMRKYSFNDRAYLPMNISGDGAMSTEDIQAFSQSMCCAILPEDTTGAAVVFCDKRSMEGIPSETRTRVCFYCAHVATERGSSHTNTFRSVFVLSRIEFTEAAQVIAKIFDEAMPAIYLGVKAFCVNPLLNHDIEDFSSTAFTNETLANFVVKMTNFFGLEGATKKTNLHTGATPSSKEMFTKMIEAGFTPDGIPEVLGGNWGRRHFEEWCRNRMPLERGRAEALCTLFPRKMMNFTTTTTTTNSHQQQQPLQQSNTTTTIIDPHQQQQQQPQPHLQQHTTTTSYHNANPQFGSPSCQFQENIQQNQYQIPPMNEAVLPPTGNSQQPMFPPDYSSFVAQAAVASHLNNQQQHHQQLQQQVQYNNNMQDNSQSHLLLPQRQEIIPHASMMLEPNKLNLPLEESHIIDHHGHSGITGQQNMLSATSNHLNNNDNMQDGIYINNEQLSHQAEEDVYSRKGVPPEIIVDETEDVVQAARRAFEDALTMIPQHEKQAYLDAIKTAPKIVEHETDPIKFLRVENFDIWAASRRLCRCWSLRKELFGERAFLPMTQTGEGTLTPDDVISLTSGTTALLPHDNRGRDVVVIDRSRIVDINNPHDAASRVRFFFYLLAVLSENEINTTEGLIGIVLVNSPDVMDPRNEVNRKCAEVWNAMPVKCRAAHLVMCPPRGGKKSIMDRLLKQVNPIVHAYVGEKAVVHTETSPRVLFKKFLEFGLSESGLPPRIGGSWKYEQFTLWQRKRAQDEEALCRIHGFERIKKTFVCSSKEDRVARKRRRNVILSRQKRERRKAEADDLQRKCDDLTSQNKSLQSENTRLETLLKQALFAIGSK